MLPSAVRFLSDEGDATGIDLDLLNEHRGRIQREIKRRGDADAQTLMGGRAFLMIVDLPNGDYIAVSWYPANDEEAVVFAIAAGEVEAPP